MTLTILKSLSELPKCTLRGMAAVKDLANAEKLAEGHECYYWEKTHTLFRAIRNPIGPDYKEVLTDAQISDRVPERSRSRVRRRRV